MTRSAPRINTQCFLPILLTLILTAVPFFSLHGSEVPPVEAKPKFNPAWENICKPKPGTQYLDGMPKEIIWLMDGAEMVLVPGGEFLFGPEKEKAQEPAFYIDKFPVTNERYKKFIDAGRREAPFMDKEWARSYNWRNRTYPKGKGKHPVVLVNWLDVIAYCKWAGKAFPTERQWEKAARGTNGRQYPWGDEFENGKCNSFHESLEVTTPVDKYPTSVSPYGCYDMSGNVWEWTCTARKDGWVVKGGSWFDGEVRVRSAAYGWARPQAKAANTGFRCLVILPK